MENKNEFVDENMLSIFLSDSEDYLKSMANELLIIEKNPESKQSIDLIFRGIHSIKGAAGIMKMNVLTEVAHRYETLLDKVRSGKLTINDEMIEFLLEGIEIFERLLANIKTKKEDIEFEDMKSFLGVSKEEFIESAEKFFVDIPKKEKVHSNVKGKENHNKKSEKSDSFRIDIVLFEDEIMKKARMFMVYNTLSNVGSIEQSVPSIEEIREDEFEVDENACFYISTEKDKTQLEKILSSFEIKSYSVAKNVSIEEIAEKKIVKDEKKALDNNEKSGIFRIDIVLFDDEIMKKARIFMVYNTLARMGKIIQSVPSVDEIHEDEFEVDENACFYLETEKDKVQIEKVLETFEIKSYSVVRHIEREKTQDTSKEKKENQEGEVIQKIEEKKVEEKIIEKAVEKIEIKKSETEVKDTKVTDAEKKAKQTKTESDVKIKEYIKVEKEKLDNLFNIVGELFIEKSVYSQMYIRLGEIYTELSETGVPQKTLKNLVVYLDSLNMLNKKQERELSELQEVSNSLRMIPIKESFASYGMAVRMLSSKLKKKVELEIKGEDTELDKLISEKLTDPILHMIRNSLDHGIETAEERKNIGKPELSKLLIEAYNSGNEVVIKIVDDGKGIDVNKITDKAIEKGLISVEESKKLTEKEKLDIIFLPGFSTADQVSEVSGRGVGMDVVKRNIDMVKGKVEVETVLGKGTSFTIKIPLTLAIIRALLVTSGKNIYAFSSDTAVTVEKILKENVNIINNIEVMKFRDEVVPIFSLRKIFGNNVTEYSEEEQIEETNSKHYKILILKQGKKLYGFKVDDFLNQQYIVVKNIEGKYHKGKAIIGAAVLGDGALAMVIDTNDLMENINSHKFNIEV